MTQSLTLHKIFHVLDQEDRKKIKMAMEVISKNSCVNFQELPAHDTSHHVQIFSGAGYTFLLF